MKAGSIRERETLTEKKKKRKCQESEVATKMKTARAGLLGTLTTLRRDSLSWKNRLTETT